MSDPNFEAIKRDTKHIKEYSTKKVVDYVKPGDRCIIRFGHGLGDTMMFYPAFEQLKAELPLVHFDIYLESGQEDIFPCMKSYSEDEYDYIFDIHFQMSEGTKYAKAELCCMNELGISPVVDIYEFPAQANPLVLLHLQSTSLPDSVNCQYDTAQVIYNEVLELGLVPMECHLEHMFHNPVNAKYDFVQAHVRNVKAKISTLVGMMQNAGYFIGVASGPLVVAMSTMPERTIYLKKDFTVDNYTTKDILEVDIKDYQAGTISDALHGMM